MRPNIRRVQRGMVRYNLVDYFAIELADFDGQDVLVEPINEDNVRVFDMSGVFLCTANEDRPRVTEWKSVA